MASDRAFLTKRPYATGGGNLVWDGILPVAEAFKCGLKTSETQEVTIGDLLSLLQREVRP